jgi:putative ABC transport system permease protein
MAWPFQHSATPPPVAALNCPDRPVRDLSQPLRYAARTLRKSAGFSAVAVLTLALGIGGTALVYGLIDAVVLRPLPCPLPDRMFLVVESHPQRGKMLVRPANYEEWRHSAPWLDRSGMAFATEFVLIDEARHIPGALVDEGFFETWGVAPRSGRPFGRADFERAAAPEFFGKRGGGGGKWGGLW